MQQRLLVAFWAKFRCHKWANHLAIRRGSGCGSVGRAVASDTRGPWFESSHWQYLYWTLFTVNCTEKTTIKKKEARNGPLKNLAIRSHCPWLTQVFLLWSTKGDISKAFLHFFVFKARDLDFILLLFCKKRFFCLSWKIVISGFLSLNNSYFRSHSLSLSISFDVVDQEWSMIISANLHPAFWATFYQSLRNLHCRFQTAFESLHFQNVLILLSQLIWAKRILKRPCKLKTPM